MFEFAISRNQRRPPSKITIGSWIASCLVHVLLVIVLVENPHLLRGGRVHDFRGISLPWKLFENSEDDIENNRIVTFTKPMEMPSEATLKKYLYDWDKKRKDLPPVKVPWKGGPDISLAKKAPATPKVQAPKAPEASVPANKIASTVYEPVPGTQEAASKQPGGPVGAQISAQIDEGKKGIVNLPAPSPANPEVAKNIAPSTIPNSIKPSAPPNGKEAVKVFDNETQAIAKEGSGFFDIPKGFPLGEYANKIIERIKGRWFIPSNLRNSQGRTTVIFYIDKNGRFSGTRIVMGSGNNSLDFAALNAIIQSDPADPLPPGFPGDRIGAKFVFSYNEPR
jgi:TonB family protein